jgi:hypothetical protein
MSERSVEEVRLEIAAEREGLANDVDGLKDEAHSVVPVAVGILLAVALLAQEKRLRSGFKLLWKFI